MQTTEESATNHMPKKKINIETKEIALACAKAALAKKAERVKVLDIAEVSSVADYFVICSAMSDRQVKAILDSVESELRLENVRPLSVEGEQEARWILVDFGDVVVHIFLDAIRDFYNLEELWSQAQSVELPQEFYTN